MIRARLGDDDIPAGDRAGRKKGPRLDPSGMFVNSTGWSDSTPSISTVFVPWPEMRAPGGVQEVGKGDDVRLTRGVLDARRSLGEGRGHHHVAGRPDARDVESDPTSPQLLRRRDDVAVLEFDLRSERFHPLDVEIDGARPPGAAARQRDARATAAGEQRTEHVNRRAHLPNEIIRRLGARDLGCIESKAVVLVTPFDAEQPKQVEQGHDVTQMRDVPKEGLARDQKGCGHHRQGGILRAADRDFSREGLAPGDLDGVHAVESPPPAPGDDTAGLGSGARVCGCAKLRDQQGGRESINRSGRLAGSTRSASR